MGKLEQWLSVDGGEGGEAEWKEVEGSEKAHVRKQEKTRSRSVDAGIRNRCKRIHRINKRVYEVAQGQWRINENVTEKRAPSSVTDIWISAVRFAAQDMALWGAKSDSPSIANSET